MSEMKDPLLLDHEYDGIGELDNKLPRWWVWLFNFCILFAALYLVHYHVIAKGELAKDGQMVTEYRAEMKIGDQIKLAALAKFETDMATLTPSKDPAVIAEGQRLFANLCAPCHRADGGGLVGPNLTDDYWIHGPEFKDNLRTIYNGVPEKGMITWKAVLKPNEMYASASYIYTLRGAKLTTPGKPREDQTPKETGPSKYE
jgi:cytochrome c oxidase cbb3-type subunit III